MVLKKVKKGILRPVFDELPEKFYSQLMLNSTMKYSRPSKKKKNDSKMVKYGDKRWKQKKKGRKVLKKGILRPVFEMVPEIYRSEVT